MFQPKNANCCTGIEAMLTMETQSYTKKMEQKKKISAVSCDDWRATSTGPVMQLGHFQSNGCQGCQYHLSHRGDSVRHTPGCHVPPVHFLMKWLQAIQDLFVLVSYNFRIIINPKVVSGLFLYKMISCKSHVFFRAVGCRWAHLKLLSFLDSLDILPVCPQRFAPSYNCRGRASLLPHRYLFHWVCRWFVNHQRRLYADPTVRAVRYRLCEKDIVASVQIKKARNKTTAQCVSRVPGSWWWCCPLGLCTQSCLPSPLGRFCLPQQTSASQRTCRWSWSPNPPSSHRLHLCPHSHSHIWAKISSYYLVLCSCMLL